MSFKMMLIIVLMVLSGCKKDIKWGTEFEELEVKEFGFRKDGVMVWRELK